MSDNKLTDERGLYQVPDEPEPPPLQGSVSAPVSAMGRADAPEPELRECPHCDGESEVAKHQYGGYYPRCMTPNCINELGSGRNYRTEEAAREAWNRRDGEAARVAEAVAQERARIVAALKDEIMDWEEHTGATAEVAAHAFKTAILLVKDIPS
jgi:hypothetical protein